jgi:hypothetical protein
MQCIKDYVLPPSHNIRSYYNQYNPWKFLALIPYRHVGRCVDSGSLEVNGRVMVYSRFDPDVVWFLVPVSLSLIGDWARWELFSSGHCSGCIVSWLVWCVCASYGIYQPSWPLVQWNWCVFHSVSLKTNVLLYWYRGSTKD